MHLRYLPHVSLPALNHLCTVEQDDIHLTSSPLHLLHDIQTTMHNKLIHVSRLLRKPCDTITALLRSAKLIFKKRVIKCTNYAEVVWHLDLPITCCVGVWGFGRGRSALRSYPEGWLVENVKSWRPCIRASISWEHEDESRKSHISTTMFGAFRPTNSLGGGLLWYISPCFFPLRSLL